MAPFTQITRIDNDLTAWFSKTDPLYQDYERLRKEFEGSRTLIVALEGDTVFTPQGLDHLRAISREIERVPTVQRVHSLATANTVEAIGSNSELRLGYEGGCETSRAGYASSR